jgi:Secretion system C-terminal sorting domain
MKKILIGFIITFIVHLAYGQTVSVHLKPGPAAGKDAFLASFGSNVNYGNHPEYTAIGWTCGGVQCIGRSLLEFDLSSIPLGATVQSASLDLYANTSPNNGNGSPMFGPNAAKLYRVTSSWNESSVTYNSQPTYDINNPINLPASTSAFQNYLAINVTSMVSDMVSNPSSNFGFLLKLNSELPFSSIIFASSDFSDSLLWPELNVEYTLGPASDTCIVFSLSDPLSSDAYISSNAPLSNYANHPEFSSISWSCQGTPCYGRSLMNFDFSAIPVNSIVNLATLNLYANPSPVNGNGIAMQGANTSILSRVVTPWTENGVTWATQPNTVSQNSVVLQSSSSSFQNYTNVNVTNLVADILNNPLTSYGFLLRLQNEVGYTSMTFASSDYSNASLTPTLEVCYSLFTSLNSIANFPDFDLVVSPNPIRNEELKISISSTVNSAMEFSLLDIDGKNLYSWGRNVMPIKGQEISLPLSNISNLSNGIYLIKVNNGKTNLVKRVVIIKD